MPRLFPEVEQNTLERPAGKGIAASLQCVLYSSV